MTADSVTSGPVRRTKSSASTASEYGYPHGHLGHLGEHEAEQLAAFKASIAAEGLYKPGPPPSHEDQDLLRFLRARRWVVADAFKQFKDTEEWRAANDIDVLYHTIDLEAYEQCRRLYPQWTGRRDRRGIPIYVFEIHSLDSKTISDYEKQGASTTFSRAKTDGKTDPGMLRLFALYENLTRFNMPLCTQLQDREFPGTPITMSTNIVDVSNVSLRQFWNLKGHMQAASQLATAHYPETLDRIFIIGAPFFFSTVWGWIKRWFDPITVSKIFILNHHEVLPTLTAFIDPANIPKKYGGGLDFRFGGKPIRDPAYDAVVRFEEGRDMFPIGPMVWREAEGSGGDRLECVTLGCDKGKDLERAVVATVLRTWPAPRDRDDAEDVKEAKPDVNGVSAETTASIKATQKGEVPVETTTETKAAPETAPAGESRKDEPAETKPAPANETTQPPKVKPTEDAAAPVTAGEAVEKLTVSEAITGAEREVEVSEKVTAEGVPPAVPATVA